MSHKPINFSAAWHQFMSSGLTAFNNDADKNTFPEALIKDILMELTRI